MPSWIDAGGVKRYGRDLHDGARELVPITEASEVMGPALAPEAELEAAQAQDQRRAVERTMTRLRVDDAEVLRLKYLEQRPPDEIAAELERRAKGVQVGAISSVTPAAR